jgi:hypothetical protein
MILPPKTTEATMLDAIARFQEAVGADWVFTDEVDLHL